MLCVPFTNPSQEQVHQLIIVPPHSNPPDFRKDAKPSTSRSLRLEDWRRQLQTHEQLSMGHSTGRSEAKMKAFLDDVEKKIDGDKEMKSSRKRSSKKPEARK